MSTAIAVFLLFVGLSVSGDSNGSDDGEQFVCNVRCAAGNMDRSCWITSEEYCYSVVQTLPERSVTYSEAVEICRKKESHPANIYDIEKYTMLVRYIKAKRPRFDPILYLWLGMTYDPQSRNIHLFDNTLAEYEPKWGPKENKREGGNLGLMVVATRQKQEDYVWMAKPSVMVSGVICEKKQERF